jgi:uncharacterized membrane protein
MSDVAYILVGFVIGYAAGTYIGVKIAEWLLDTGKYF